MQDVYPYSKGTKNATIGGTLLSILGNLHIEDLISTAVLAALGAMVSFVVSLVLNLAVKRLKK